MTGRPVRSGGYREPSNPSESGGGRETTTLWSAADRGDTEKVRELLTGSGSGSGEGGAVAGGGGKPFGKADRSRFLDALERETRAAMRG